MKEYNQSDIIRVKHIKEAINEVFSFIEGKTRDSLDRDRMLVLALIKELELVGEAAANISIDFQQRHDAVPWPLLIATRNRLIHGYFNINLDTIWNTVSRDLFELMDKLEKIQL